jgi:FtsH-binding integral membrane protein
VLLDLTAAAGSSMGLLSDQQAIALALPGTLLTVGGLTATAARTNEEIAHSGFRAGYLLAALLSFCRSTSCRKHGN